MKTCLGHYWKFEKKMAKDSDRTLCDCNVTGHKVSITLDKTTQDCGIVHMTQEIQLYSSTQINPL